MAQLIDGTIKGLCDHVGELLGIEVEHRIVRCDPTTVPVLVLVLHGLDIDMNGELYHEEEEE
jgi:hypothetical protein